jgi:glycolate oxidase
MEDVGAPRSKLVELLDAIHRVVTEGGLNCGTFGHAGDGNLHPTFWWERGDAEAEARVTAACEQLYRAAIDLGGTVTGEHGIGVARLKFLELQRGAGAVRVMHQIKAALDPLNLLNPGRAV